jgi:hypothetical protein
MCVDALLVELHFIKPKNDHYHLADKLWDLITTNAQSPEIPKELLLHHLFMILNVYRPQRSGSVVPTQSNGRAEGSDRASGLTDRQANEVHKTFWAMYLMYTQHKDTKSHAVADSFQPQINDNSRAMAQQARNPVRPICCMRCRV